MISLKCRNCAGEMSVDLKGELICPYCGSKVQLSDKELEDYKTMRLNMLHFLRAEADYSKDKEDGDFFETYYENISYHSTDGLNISIHYLFFSEEDGIRAYVAKDSVIYVFPENEKQKVSKMLEGIKSVQYPPAALKKLNRYIPTIKAMKDLDDGGVLVAVDKPENVYPLYAFGSILPEHVAWIVSRLENICCILEFSGIIHNGISINSVYINTKTHEAFLYGGWWNWSKKNDSDGQNDLYALRKVAVQILGEYKAQAPDLFIKFISEKPASDAYLDFEKWDAVIEKGFGGHKFIKF